MEQMGKMKKTAKRPRVEKVATRIEKKNRKVFFDLNMVQTIRAHQSSIWVSSFSKDGKHLATGGKDGNLKVWKVLEDDLARPEPFTLFNEEPYRNYEKHELDIIALAWCESSPNLLLSSAFD